MKPPALSNLRCFSFIYNDNLEALLNIIQTSKNTLKIIEILPSDQDSFEDHEELIPVFELVQDTLEGIFTRSFCD